MKSKLSPVQVSILRAVEAGKSIPEIAETVDRDVENVRKFLKRHKIKVPRAPKGGPLEEAMLTTEDGRPRIEVMFDTKGATATAEHYGVSRWAVYKRIASIRTTRRLAARLSKAARARARRERLRVAN